MQAPAAPFRFSWNFYDKEDSEKTSHQILMPHMPANMPLPEKKWTEQQKLNLTPHPRCRCLVGSPQPYPLVSGMLRTGFVQNIFDFSETTKSQKIPNYTITWSHQTGKIMPQNGKIPNYKRNSQKMTCIWRQKREWLSSTKRYCNRQNYLASSLICYLAFSRLKRDPFFPGSNSQSVLTHVVSYPRLLKANQSLLCKTSKINDPIPDADPEYHPAV